MSNSKKREISGNSEILEDNQNKKVKIDNGNTSINSAKKFMPLKNLSSRASSSFKSPLMNRIVKNSSINNNEVKLEEKIVSLELALSNIEIEISSLEKDNSSEDLGTYY